MFKKVYTQKRSKYLFRQKDATNHIFILVARYNFDHQQLRTVLSYVKLF